MILAEVMLAALLLALLRGGSIRQLASESIKGEWVLLLMLPVQVAWPALSTRIGLRCDVSLLVWLVMMAALAAVLMINSRRRWMLALAALGIASNILVIGINQAMPVSIRAASEIGGTRSEARASLGEDCLHEEADERTLLPFLADVIGIPGPSWQRAVISVGDVMLVLGLGLWIVVSAGGRED